MVEKRRPYLTCVFSNPAMKQVDDRVKVAWEAVYPGKRVPFGDLRQQWIRRHCQVLRPMGGPCPYSEAQCTSAFVNAITETLAHHPRVPVGYFRRVATSQAAIRADNKPLARDTVRHEPFIIEEEAPQGPRDHGDAPVHLRPGRDDRAGDDGSTGGVPEGVGPAATLRRVGPRSLAQVFGSLDLGPRPRRHDREEGDDDRRDEEGGQGTERS